MLTKNFRIPQRVADDLNYIKLRNSGEDLIDRLEGAEKKVP